MRVRFALKVQQCRHYIQVVLVVEYLKFCFRFSVQLEGQHLQTTTITENIEMHGQLFYLDVFLIRVQFVTAPRKL